MHWIGLFLALGVALAQASPYYERCARLYSEGALEAAEATCELALVADPNHPPSQLLLIRIYLEKGDLEKADSLLERLPETPEKRRLKARLLLREGDGKDVLPNLQGDPTPEARLLRAQALYRLGHFEEAERELLEGPFSPEARFLLAEIKARLQKPQEALAALGNTPKERLLKAQIALYLGRAKEAIPTLEALIPSLEGKASREALGLLALAYYAAGDWVRGGVALAQFSQVESLPGLFL
ncbi:MAG: tetratricopeptide repeat protein, partial [Thermaceae bacterium]